jgi:hypothetical protein
LVLMMMMMVLLLLLLLGMIACTPAPAAAAAAAVVDLHFSKIMGMHKQPPLFFFFFEFRTLPVDDFSLALVGKTKNNKTLCIAITTSHLLCVPIFPVLSSSSVRPHYRSSSKRRAVFKKKCTYLPVMGHTTLISKSIMQNLRDLKLIFPYNTSSHGFSFPGYQSWFSGKLRKNDDLTSFVYKALSVLSNGTYVIRSFWTIDQSSENER